MSDDGYYVGSPYDESEDGWWDAEPGPDLVDDLAEHAAYSPVWQDDPLGELEPYHSDWEYYSDDYYDDDPAILRHDPIDGTSAQPDINAKRPTLKRGHKRKLDDVRNTLDVGEHDSLKNCIRGTVWARGEAERIATYHVGEQEKVALLTNWRDIFTHNDETEWLSGSRRLKMDETWANDLGLPDMGLLNERENLVTQQISPSDEKDESVVQQFSDDEEGRKFDDVEASPMLNAQLNRHSDQNNVPASDVEEDSRPILIHKHADEGGTISRKRRRISGQSPPSHRKSIATLTGGQPTSKSSVSTTEIQGRKMNRSGDGHAGPSSEEAINYQDLPSQAMRSGKKRKLSITSSTASEQVKFQKTSPRPEDLEDRLAAVARRSTRSRNK